MRTALTLAVVVALALPFAVRADGDPASDYLIGADAYLPYPPPSAPARATLSAALAAARNASGRVKVAVIATPTDLGAIPSLYGQPGDYARFLGTEIRFAYPGPLLVVMPSGFGFAVNARADPAGDATLARIAIADRSPDGLTRAAAQAVTALAKAGALAYTDTKKPNVVPSPGKGTAGKPIELHYQASDDSGRVQVSLTVLAGSRTIAAFTFPMRPVNAGVLYAVRWTVPRAQAQRALALCARGVDPSGNRSAAVCAKLSIR